MESILWLLEECPRAQIYYGIIYVVTMSQPQIFQSNNDTSDYAADRYKYIENAAQLSSGKKWYGNSKSRDASSVIAKRRVGGVGAGALNASFAANAPKNVHLNDVTDALRRVRAGGAVAPAQKRLTHGVGATPMFPAAPLVRTDCRATIPITGKLAMMTKPNLTNVPTKYH